MFEEVNKNLSALIVTQTWINYDLKKIYQLLYF